MRSATGPSGILWINRIADRQNRAAGCGVVNDEAVLGRDDPDIGVLTAASDVEHPNIGLFTVRNGSRAGDRARGEDLAQHGLAVAYVTWPAIRHNQPEAYVRRAVLNRYLDWWRRVRWRERPLPDTADPGAALTARERAVVVLRFWLDLSEAQIAAELRIAPGTVRSTCGPGATLRRSTASRTSA